MFFLYIWFLYLVSIDATLRNIAVLRHRSRSFEQQYLSGDTATTESPLPLYSPSTVQDEALLHNHELQEPLKGPNAFSALVDALATMQSHYFEIWQGDWPSAIDWTAAVMGTHVSATLAAFAESRAYTMASAKPGGILQRIQWYENLINRYFTQMTAFYFGENAFALRTQAYDDMLWVVLDWLESIKFINQHSKLQHAFGEDDRDSGTNSNESRWYGQQFVPQFAHRARVFYDLASKGWDTSLCGGGMVWNPYLAPYKNAITNELYIAASVSMYLYFPGDDNTSPFSSEREAKESAMPPAKAHDPKYLYAATEAYDWLSKSSMKNDMGLYTDGFHIRGWKGGKNGSTGTGRCDIRDEQVYTYNQGVLLSGLRGLWEATGHNHYLEDGHELIRNVIVATGWFTHNPADRWRWAGLGRDGVLEEACDSSGSCSQDGQTFKGVFFHHLTLFCAPLPRGSNGDGVTIQADDDLATYHRVQCLQYSAWIRHNAEAAYATRDSNGKFGMWWGRQARARHSSDEEVPNYEMPTPEGTDYRNKGVPNDELWRLLDDTTLKFQQQQTAFQQYGGIEHHTDTADKEYPRDPNTRGRGRTVETQSGGLAVLRALWRLVEARNAP
jgi:hypothetical protein